MTKEGDEFILKIDDKVIGTVKSCIIETPITNMTKVSQERVDMLVAEGNKLIGNIDRLYESLKEWSNLIDRVADGDDPYKIFNGIPELEDLGKRMNESFNKLNIRD